MNFFRSVENSMNSLTGILQGISLSLVILCLVFVGLMFIFGEGPSRLAKKWLVYIIVGSLIVFGAATLGSTIKDVSGF